MYSFLMRISCQFCGNEYTRQLERCPSCGAEFNYWYFFRHYPWVELQVRIGIVFSLIYISAIMPLILGILRHHLFYGLAASLLSASLLILFREPLLKFGRVGKYRSLLCVHRFQH